jgi:hypothetical protein
MAPFDVHFPPFVPKASTFRRGTPAGSPGSAPGAYPRCPHEGCDPAWRSLHLFTPGLFTLCVVKQAAQSAHAHSAACSHFRPSFGCLHACDPPTRRVPHNDMQPRPEPLSVGVCWLVRGRPCRRVEPERLRELPYVVCTRARVCWQRAPCPPYRGCVRRCFLRWCVACLPCNCVCAGD